MVQIECPWCAGPASFVPASRKPAGPRSSARIAACGSISRRITVVSEFALAA